MYILGISADAFFLGKSRRPSGHYGPPKPSYSAHGAKPSYEEPYESTYESTAVEVNEIDDGYGSPAAPVISKKPEPTYSEPPKPAPYHPPMKATYHPPPSPHKMPMYKMKTKPRKPSYNRHIKVKPMYMMFPKFKMPRYKFPKMRLPKFMRMMPKFPKFPRMPLYGRFKVRRPMYGKRPVPKPMAHDHGGYKHMQNLDYSGWKPIGMPDYPAPSEEEPSYNAINESPIITVEDAYKSPSSKPIPPLPSGDGYGAPEVITAAPVHQDAYGTPQADPVSSYDAPKPAYKEPEKDSYGTPEAPPVTYKPQVTYVVPVSVPPTYEEPQPAYKEPEQDTYGEPQAPAISYQQPAAETNEYEAPKPPPAPAPTPVYSLPPVYSPSTPSYHTSPSYVQPTYHSLPPSTYQQPAYHGYNSPVEEPLFEYAPVSDLNSLAAVAAEDTYQPAAPPSPGSYQATVDANELAQEVQSGSVYVQPQYIPAPPAYPSYGEKVPISPIPHAAVEPLYYQTKPYSQTQYANPTSTYQGSGGKSSASFSIHVNGKEHGHSYEHDHKV